MYLQFYLPTNQLTKEIGSAECYLVQYIHYLSMKRSIDSSLIFLNSLW